MLAALPTSKKKDTSEVSILLHAADKSHSVTKSTPLKAGEAAQW